MKLIVKLVLGIIAGLLIGLMAPDIVVRAALTAKVIIGQLINFTIPLIILFYVMSGIASLPKNSGAMLGRTVGMAYGSTILAGIFAFLVASNLLPGMLSGMAPVAEGRDALAPFLDLEIPAALPVMTALVLAFVFGVVISRRELPTLKSAVFESREVVDVFLNSVIIPLLPLFIAGTFAEMAYEGKALSTLDTFWKVLVLAIVMHWIWLSTAYLITGLVQRRSPLGLLRNMLPAYLTALGTMSSAATIPVSLRQTKANGVSDEVADFSVPLCATIHLSGSTITIVTCATAVMMMSHDLAIASLGEVVPFLIMLGLTMIAAPGAPGGAVMAALGVLGSMLGFGEAELGLMIALYLAQDSFGTATNVTGDGVIALWVDHFARRDGVVADSDARALDEQTARSRS